MCGATGGEGGLGASPADTAPCPVLASEFCAGPEVADIAWRRGSAGVGAGLPEGPESSEGQRVWGR